MRECERDLEAIGERDRRVKIISGDDEEVNAFKEGIAG